MKTTTRIRTTTAVAGLILAMFTTAQPAPAFDVRDVFSVGAAYTTHLFFHELGHQSVAMQVGATGTEMHFFTRRGGNFYAGLSTYDTIPDKSRLPYAVAGDRMAGLTFDYALESYRHHPTTYNKALMFFSCADFLVYTLVANYVHPGDNMYDPNLIRKETGCSKGVLLSLVAGKTLLNAYRAINPKVTFAPEIWVDSTSAALLVRIPF
ncbi:MAG: hypothetical protein JRI36_01070 [Deltaproteobacteria bacterium]|nr:hypothetical protein [Deltaproteobacteria bacterium]